MSLDAIAARVAMITNAQQQLAEPLSAAAAAAGSAGGATGSTTAGAGTTFAAALASAQASGLSAALGISSADPTALSGLAGTTGATALPGTTDPSGLSGAASAGSATATAAPVPGAVIPQTSWNPQQKPIAGWIAPVLDWASQHGWTGAVTSGYRDYQQQASINASGAYSAAAGTSNHETTQYPGGAVDVSNPGQLLQVLKGYSGPYQLVGGVLGAVDPEHFSATGH